MGLLQLHLLPLLRLLPLPRGYAQRPLPHPQPLSALAGSQPHHPLLSLQVCLVLNKGKPSRDHTFPAIKAALLSMLCAWNSPFS